MPASLQSPEHRRCTGYQYGTAVTGINTSRGCSRGRVKSNVVAENGGPFNGQTQPLIPALDDGETLDIPQQWYRRINGVTLADSGALSVVPGRLEEHIQYRRRSGRC